MKKRPFAYVCSPYQGNTEKNSALARQYCRELYDAGYMPIAPHLLFPQFLDEDIPEERENGMCMARDLLRRSSSVVSCGSKYSEGMLSELMLAKRLRIPSSTLGGILVVNRRGREKR